MKMVEDNEFAYILKEETIKYGYNLDEEVINNLVIYKDLLIEWNEKMNLTNITDNYGVIIKHFIDSLECTKYINVDDNVIDVGTGAGFPGMVIAIYFKGKLKITLMDSLNKRLIFLEEVKKTLKLGNITIIHSRSEEASNEEKYRQKFDIIVSRAFARLNELLEYTIGFLKVGGRCLFMKGDNYADELDTSKNAMKVLNCICNNIYKYKLFTQDEIYNRVILEILKKGDTPKIYPRMYSKIKKNPL